MDLYEKIKELATQKNISIRQLEENLGFANATLRRWNINKPSVDKIQAVAKFFNVSVDYLLGNDDKAPVKEPVDLADLIDDDDVEWDKWVSFDGKPICDEDKLIIKRILASRKK